MTKILGYDIFSESKSALLTKLHSSENKLNIISGNPEVLYNGLSDKALFDNFVDEDTIIIPDGVGVVLASKIVKSPVTEKIPGIEVMEEVIKYCSENNESIFLLGAEQWVLDQCIENLKKKYPKLTIGGSHNGFFDLNNCQDIIDNINAARPYALFVAMGSPRQEQFIIKYKALLKVHIFMGVGGSFDVFAGKVSRAPEWMIKLSLEWLYRVSKEPTRIKRLGAIPKFLMKVAMENKK